VNGRDIPPTLRTAYNLGYLKGIQLGEDCKQNEVLELLRSKICFDNKAGCEHQSCYALEKLSQEIEGDKVD
jgi:hypothetical protein